MLEFRKENRKAEKLAYGNYDVYFGDRLVAQIRTTLCRTDRLCLYYEGYDNHKTISLKHMTLQEGLEKAGRIIEKKLYKEAQEILAGLRQSIKIE